MDQAVSHQPSLSQTCMSAVFRERSLYTFSIITAITVRRLDDHSQPAAQAWGVGTRTRWLQQCIPGSLMKLSPHRALGCLGILSFCNPREAGVGGVEGESQLPILQRPPHSQCFIRIAVML